MRTVLCDLDGVVWLRHVPIPGSVEAIERLRTSGRRVLFVTNNSAPTIAEHEAALAKIGIDARGDVVSSSMAAATLIDRQWRVLITGGLGAAEAVAARGATVVANDGEDDGQPADAVVVGLDRRFDYPRLAWAARVVRGGAQLIGTNSDATYPTPAGAQPGGGSLLAAVSTAGGAAEPVIGGKPHQPMADLIRSIVAPDGGFDGETVMMVGDRPETDGLFAARLGCGYAQVRSGVLPAGAQLPDGMRADLDVADLAAVAAELR